MTYGQFIKQNMTKKEGVQMINKILHSGLSYEKKVEFQNKEFEKIEDFDKDLKKFTENVEQEETN